MFQVWFQNRRMKDKRQRIAVAWPYAAVYSDPAFAASILQAAASSVGMPYGYPTGGVLPQMSVISQQIPTNHFPYSYRYSPYSIQQRTAHIQSNNYSIMGGLSQAYPTVSIPKSHSPPLPHGIQQSPSPPQSTISLSPGSEKLVNTLKSSISNEHAAAGLLMTTTTPVVHQQTLIKNEDKPKLFKPYKSET